MIHHISDKCPTENGCDKEIVVKYVNGRKGSMQTFSQIIFSLSFFSLCLFLLMLPFKALATKRQYLLPKLSYW